LRASGKGAMARAMDMPADDADDDARAGTCAIVGETVSIVFGIASGEAPTLIHWGTRLPPSEDHGVLRLATLPRRHGSQPDQPPGLSLWPQAGRGHLGLPAMALRRGDEAVPVDLRLADIRTAPSKVRFSLADPVAGIEVMLDWSIRAGDVVHARATLVNRGEAPLSIDRIASIAVPLPGWARQITRFHGRWAGEMQEESGAIPHGRSGGASRGGRPGFGGANWAIVHEVSFGAYHGLALALHLGWSGDHETVIERDADGTMVQMGLRLDPGEIVLAPDESFTTPPAMIAFSSAGRNGLRRALHAHVRADILPARADWGPRRVPLNSWEAVGFAMDDTRLARLADAAGAIGVERFVVDDGWFAGRHDDRTSLGDWTPDPARFPKGLDRLIDHAAGLGMDFGLWIEPEMVSPDSDLYRAHPDWCLQLTGADRPTQRHQLVLDLARAEVSEHVFAAIDRLLSAHHIAYLKWDHNRELFPADRAGYRQTLAFYALIDRLRAAHPQVEIESCASGGGRIDYGVLARCHRAWPSDNNDAIERLRIMRAWGQFLPLEVIGNHVGPSPNPITGRMLPMAFRARVAMFGHMGVEADPVAMTEADRETLAAHIDCYKSYRDLLHTGVASELAFDEPGLFGTIVVAGDKALALVARGDMAGDYNAAPVRFPGLDPDTRYMVAFPLAESAASPNRASNRALSGRALAEMGIVLPLDRPATAHIVYFESMGEGG